MYYTYVLYSRGDKKFYIGYTENLDRRIYEHQVKNVHTTARYNKPELIFFEAFKSKEDALRREQYFKTSKGRTALRLITRASLISDN